MFTAWVLGEASLQSFFNNPQTLGIVVGPLMFVLVVLGTTLTYYWYRVVKVRAEADLKQSMIERGMSPADIERVLQAKTPDK